MDGEAGIYFRFLIAALATWRLAFLVARERGPWEILARSRARVGSGIIGGLLKCVKCAGLWVAIPFAIFVRRDWGELVVMWLALAGVVALIDELTRQPFDWEDNKGGDLAGSDVNGAGDTRQARSVRT